MLTGETQFHLSTPLGIEPGSLMTGSKCVDHWTSGPVQLCINVVSLQALHRARPPPPSSQLCRLAEKRLCSEHETGIEELCEIKWDYHIVCMTA